MTREQAIEKALNGLLVTINAHDFDPLDCNQEGEKYCGCLDRRIKEACEALALPADDGWRATFEAGFVEESAPGVWRLDVPKSLGWTPQPGDVVQVGVKGGER